MLDQSGLGLELTKNADGSFIMMDKGYINYTFSHGTTTKYLNSIKDSYNNVQTIEYDTSNRIKKLTDPVKRSITLDYN